MKTLVVDEKNSNKRIDKYIMSEFKALPFAVLQKAFRKKDIKVNGLRVKQDFIVTKGDRIEIYIVDTLFEGSLKAGEGVSGRGFTVVYEDENIIIVNKEQGIPVHQDKGQTANTLIDNVRRYLKEESILKPTTPSFQASLCHRLDRNTGGLVVIAKNQESLDYILELMETRAIKKYYQCLVRGKMEKQNAQLKAWLFKDESKSRVYINNYKTPGSVEIVTGYKVLSYNLKLDISKLEVELVTGRTHQIRAHLAFIGHPIIGDGKYGSNTVNRSLSAKHQELWAYKLDFNIQSPGILHYLNGKTFQIQPRFTTSTINQYPGTTYSRGDH